jgi:hypothetical protein
MTSAFCGSFAVESSCHDDFPLAAEAENGEFGG